MKKIQKSMLAFMCFILMFTLAACGNTNNTADSGKENKTETVSKTSYPLTIKDSYDREITLDKEPQKIVSVAPNITEIVCVLGKQDKLIGRTDFCNYPENVKNIQSIGGLMEPNIEKIAELNPDIVIASTHFKKETLKKLEDLHIKVAVLYDAESFDGTYNTIKRIGQIVNANDKAESIVSNMQNKVKDVTEKVKGKNTPSVYYVVDYGKNGDFTAGKDTFISKIIEMAGGKNAADDVTGWKYSIEKLVEKNPDILICTKNFDTKNGIKNTAGYKDLTAVKNDKLYDIDTDLLDRQGPRLADGLETLAKIIHPEAFK